MTADQLEKELAALEAWTAPPKDRLREALELLRKAHNALDVMEGEVQDLKGERPSEWAQGVLKVLNEDICLDALGAVAEGMEAAMARTADRYGYASMEYEALSRLTTALDPTGKELY